MPEPLAITAFGVLSVVFRRAFGNCVCHMVCHANQLRSKPQRTRKQTAYLWVNLSLSAVLSAVGYLMQLIGAAHLPAVAIYPIVTGGVVVLTALAGLAFFRERLSVKGWVSIALTFGATVLFMF